MLQPEAVERPGSRRQFVTCLAVSLIVFSYLVFIRTRRISQTFWLLGDQILYWRMALGSWRDLPIGGGPSSVGGATPGPLFLWRLLGVRQNLWPLTHNPPHPGGGRRGVLLAVPRTAP